MSGSHGGGRNRGGRRGRNRDPNPSLLIDENVVAQIGGIENFFNLPDPNTFHPAGVGGSEVAVGVTAPIGEDPNVFPRQNPAALGGSEVPIAAAPIGEGTSQYRQRAKKARHDLPISSPPPPPPPQLLQQSREPPLPGPPALHYPVENMGGTPDALQRKDQLHELCTKKLSNRDMEMLVITGRNRPFLIQKIARAGLEFPASVFVHIINGPTRIVQLDKKENSDKLTLLWAPIVASDGFRLVRGQLVDMWFEIDTEVSWPTIYISGDRLQN